MNSKEEDHSILKTGATSQISEEKAHQDKDKAARNDLPSKASKPEDNNVRHKTAVRKTREAEDPSNRGHRSRVREVQGHSSNVRLIRVSKVEANSGHRKTAVSKGLLKIRTGIKKVAKKINIDFFEVCQQHTSKIIHHSFIISVDICKKSL